MTNRARLTDTVARTSRATGQTGLGFAIIDLLDAFHPLTTHQFGALVALAGVIVAAAQNWLENRGTIPALFKALPPGPTPVVDTVKDSGQSFVWFLIAALAVCAGILLAHVISHAL